MAATASRPGRLAIRRVPAPRVRSRRKRTDAEAVSDEQVLMLEQFERILKIRAQDLSDAIGAIRELCDELDALWTKRSERRLAELGELWNNLSQVLGREHEGMTIRSTQSRAKRSQPLRQLHDGQCDKSCHWHAISREPAISGRSGSPGHLGSSPSQPNFCF